MNFSAASSSSRVVMPGRTFPASRFRVLTRTAPAAAIRSISSGLFLMITRPSLEVVLEPQSRDHRTDVIVDLGRVARAVDPPHHALLVEVVDQRGGLLVVNAQAVLDDLGIVVVAADQA